MPENEKSVISVKDEYKKTQIGTIIQKMRNFLFIIIIASALTSCNEYQKALKKDDISKKFEVATMQYDKGKYSKAIRLFAKPQFHKLI